MGTGRSSGGLSYRGGGRCGKPAVFGVRGPAAGQSRDGVRSPLDSAGCGSHKVLGRGKARSRPAQDLGHWG